MLVIRNPKVIHRVKWGITETNLNINTPKWVARVSWEVFRYIKKDVDAGGVAPAFAGMTGVRGAGG